MQIRADQLTQHLQRGLVPVYLVSGDEPLLVGECADAIRQAAHAQGCEERQVLTVEPGFDWNALYASTQSLSLFSERRLIDLRIPTGRPGEAGAKMLAQIVTELPEGIVLLVTTGKLDKQMRQAKWAKQLEQAGVAVTLYPVEPAQLPGWIRRRMQVRGLKAAPGVVESILEAQAIIVCPSNPATSIGPILAVPRVRQALRQTSAEVVAVSPMVQGRSFSGPAHKLMHALGVEASVVGLATAYRDFVNVLVIGPEDKGSREGIEALGMRPLVTSIRMDTAEDKRKLAGEVLASVGVKSWTM